MGFPDCSIGKEFTCNAGDHSSIPGSWRSAGEGICLQCGRPGCDRLVGKVPWRRERFPPQYSDLENAINCIVHGVTKSWTYLSDFHYHFIDQINSVQFTLSVVSDSLWHHRLRHTRPPCPSPTPRACSSSCPSSWWCPLTISSFVVPFSSCLHSFPASGSFQMSQFFPLGGQSIGISASASVLPMNTQDWSPLGWTGWISLQSKGLSSVFSNTTVQKHQLFCAQLSLYDLYFYTSWLPDLTPVMKLFHTESKDLSLGMKHSPVTAVPSFYPWEKCPAKQVVRLTCTQSKHSLINSLFSSFATILVCLKMSSCRRNLSIFLASS